MNQDLVSGLLLDNVTYKILFSLTHGILTFPTQFIFAHPTRLGMLVEDFFVEGLVTGASKIYT